MTNILEQKPQDWTRAFIISASMVIAAIAAIMLLWSAHEATSAGKKNFAAHLQKVRDYEGCQDKHRRDAYTYSSTGIREGACDSLKP